jgi:glutaminase
MKQKLENVVKSNKKYTKEGRVASYIPELAMANAEHLGVCINDGTQMYCSGDFNVKFTLQSVSKSLVLILALMDHGEAQVFEKVGKEPTGDPFNSIIRLETYKKQKPYNPMINAGAIAIAGLIKGEDVKTRVERILMFIRKIAHNTEIKVNEAVYNSEKETGHRNRAIANFLKDIGNIEGDPNEVLEVYFSQCSIEVDCRDLSNIAMVLALDGKSHITGEELFPTKYAKIAKAYMMTCGMYDGSGEFAIKVGIPAKSGVGGGILAIVPRRYGIGVFGPALDEKGNSIAGLKILEALSEDMDFNIF